MWYLCFCTWIVLFSIVFSRLIYVGTNDNISFCSKSWIAIHTFCRFIHQWVDSFIGRLHLLAVVDDLSTMFCSEMFLSCELVNFYHVYLYIVYLALLFCIWYYLFPEKIFLINILVVIFCILLESVDRWIVIMGSVYMVLFKSGKVIPAYNPNTGEPLSRWSWVQGKLGLLSEFQASQGFIARPCVKKQGTK